MSTSLTGLDPSGARPVRTRSLKRVISSASIRKTYTKGKRYLSPPPSAEGPWNEEVNPYDNTTHRETYCITSGPVLSQPPRSVENPPPGMETSSRRQAACTRALFPLLGLMIHAGLNRGTKVWAHLLPGLDHSGSCTICRYCTDKDIFLHRHEDTPHDAVYIHGVISLLRLMIHAGLNRETKGVGDLWISGLEQPLL
jgi:hypothetical protein